MIVITSDDMILIGCYVMMKFIFKYKIYKSKRRLKF